MAKAARPAFDGRAVSNSHRKHSDSPPRWWVKRGACRRRGPCVEWLQADALPDVLLRTPRAAQDTLTARPAYVSAPAQIAHRRTLQRKQRALCLWCAMTFMVTTLALVVVTTGVRREETARAAAQLARLLTREAALMTDPQHAFRAAGVDPAAPMTWQDACRRGQAAAVDMGRVPVPVPILTRVQLCDDLAIVELDFSDLGMTETRVYRLAPGGWVRTVPSTACWGAASIVESAFFRVMVQERDAAAVNTALPALDQLYVQQRALVGLPPPDAREGKQLIVVDVAHLATQLVPDGTASRRGDVLTVPSPLLTAAPPTLTHAQVFVQAVALPLAESVMHEALCARAGCDRQPYVLHQGIALWLQWHASGDDMWAPNRGLLEAVWQAQTDAHGVPHLRDLARLPTGLDEYWRRERYVAVRPDGCAVADNDCWADVEYLISSGAIPAPDMSVMAAASLVDYLVERYGADVIVELLTASAQADELTSVLETATGVPLATIEAGWHAALAARTDHAIHDDAPSSRLDMRRATPKDCSPQQTALQ